MSERGACVVVQQQIKPIKIVKWKVREGGPVPVGKVILLYEFPENDKKELRKLKATNAGTIHKIYAKENDVVNKGENLYELRACSHPTIVNDMCAECGEDLRNDDSSTKISASVPMVHSIPDLKVSEEQAQELGKADSDRLLKDRKLVLLVDLDQTLIHTTNDNIPPNIKDVYHFQLYGSNSPWYHTRLRPGTHKFLNKIFDYYELHICTFGARNYAHTIAMFLDPDQKFFSNRILSRDECFDPTSKKANLKALFPCGDELVCIIDDREDVWSHASNLIHVKPYHFFQHTGDINAPPGLDKHENDEKIGVDLSKFVNKDDKKASDENSESDVVKEDKESEDCNSESEKNEKSEDGEEKEEKDEREEKEEREEPLLTNGNKETNNDKETVETDIESSKIDQNSKPTKNGKLKPVETDPKNPKSDENVIEVEDSDDYLVYLEEILKRIHKTFYEQYDHIESGSVPDLKKVIPTVRGQVLKGTRLVFSGLVPTHVKLEDSKAYQVARSLGACVTQDIDDDTTHLVAVRPGTAKVNFGRRKKNLKIVTPDWLWCCAERWEHVDERIFPLNSKGSKNRHPPPHCSSPEHIASYPEHDTPAARKRTPSGRFMDTINPLMSFSSDDIADMDKEVEDILEDESEDSAEEEEEKSDPIIQVLEHVITEQKEEENDSTSNSVAEEEEDNNDEDNHRGQKRKRTIDEEDDETRNGSSSESDLPSVRFKRGEMDVNSDVDTDRSETQVEESDNSLEPPDEVDDGEWNVMGAALEREFLSD